MAALQLKEESSNRIVFQTGLGQRLANIGSLVGFGWIFCICFGSLLSRAGSDDQETLFLILALALFALYAAYKLLATTTTSLDLNSRLASSTTSLFGIPLRRSELPFDRVKQVKVSSRFGASATRGRGTNIWSLTLEPTEGRPFVLNRLGSHDEMLALGQKVGAFLSRPVVEAEPSAVEQQLGPILRPLESLSGPSSSLPPVALPSPLGGRRPTSTLPDKEPPPNIFMPDAPSAEHQRFEQEAQEEPAAQNSAAQAASVFESATLPTMPAPLPSSEQGTPLYTPPAALELPDQKPIGELSAMTTPIPDIPTAAPESAPAPPRRRSLQELQQAIADDPNDSVAQYQLARMLHARGALDQAAELYRTATRLDPMDMAAQNDLGVLYLQRSNFKEAEAALRRAVGLDPFSVSSHYNLGLALARQGRRKEAEQEFSRAQQNASNDSERQLAEAALKGRLAAPILTPEQS